MTNLRKKLFEYYDSGAEFPYQDIMIFLSGVIKNRLIMAHWYDPDMTDFNRTNVPKSFKKLMIEDKLIITQERGWTQGRVLEACHNFLVESIL